MRILGRLLTILAGAIPATYLSFIAAFGVYFGALAVLEGEMGGWLLVVWGGAGIYGTLCLWAVSFGQTRAWVVAGLVVGTIALAPLALLAASSLGSWSPDDLEAMTLIGPIVVAISWLCVLTVQFFHRPGNNTAEYTVEIQQ